MKSVFNFIFAVLFIAKVLIIGGVLHFHLSWWIVFTPLFLNLGLFLFVLFTMLFTAVVSAIAGETPVFKFETRR